MIPARFAGGSMKRFVRGWIVGVADPAKLETQYKDSNNPAVSGSRRLRCGYPPGNFSSHLIGCEISLCAIQYHSRDSIACIDRVRVIDHKWFRGM